MAKTHETSSIFGILTRPGGFLGASWGPLGGLLEASRLGCLLKASWGPLGGLSGASQKSKKKPEVFNIRGQLLLKKLDSFVKFWVATAAGRARDQNLRMSRAFLTFLLNAG